MAGHSALYVSSARCRGAESRGERNCVWIGLSRCWTGAVSGTSGHVGRASLSPTHCLATHPSLTSTNVNNNSARCCCRRRRRSARLIYRRRASHRRRAILLCCCCFRWADGGADMDVASASEWSAATPTVIRSTASPSVAAAAAAAAQFSVDIQF